MDQPGTPDFGSLYKPIKNENIMSEMSNVGGTDWVQRTVKLRDNPCKKDDAATLNKVQFSYETEEPWSPCKIG